jgi:myo-inositol-1(or 4)-monophosphatase
MQELQVAREAARLGGEIVAGHYRRGVAVRSKAASELVTDADLESEQAIVALIRREFPAHAVLGEEQHAADVSAEHLWIVDPLDGTTNFAHQVPHFAVSVAYYRGGEPVCGVVWNPVRDDWYEAVRGGGATHNGRRVQVAAHARLDETLIGVGFYYDRGAMMEATLAAIRDLFRQNIHGIRRFGTAALDLCHVGCGLYGAFFEYQLSPWDFAAGRLFVEEAGGRVTTCRGERLPVEKSSVLASNGALHEAVLDVVRRHHL